jgi:hypothetical protein
VTVQFDSSRPAQPWSVRWREAGRHRRRRFTSEHSARAFAAAHTTRSPSGVAGVDTELSPERSGPRTPAAGLMLGPGPMHPTPPDAAVVAQLRTELNELRDAVARASGDASAVASAAGVYPYETSAGTRWRFAFRQSDGSLSNRRGFASPRAAATAKRRLEESIVAARSRSPATRSRCGGRRSFPTGATTSARARSRTRRPTGASGCCRSSAGFGLTGSTSRSCASGSAALPRG